jgi:hypothetical protein
MFTLQQHGFRLRHNRLGERQGKHSASRVAEEDGTDTIFAHEGTHEYGRVSDGGEHVLCGRP